MFKDYQELADPLVLPINGKSYTVPAVGLADGIKLTAALDPESKTPVTDDEFNRMLLGTAYNEMLADNVPGPAVIRASLTALADFQKGRETAEIMWETGGDPKALTAWVKAATNRAQRRSTGTGAAKKTPSPASTNGTKTSRAS